MEVSSNKDHIVKRLKENVRSATNPRYRGPGDDFPYMGFQVLGTVHVLVAVATMTAAVVHLTLSQEDRTIFLLTGAVAMWCPATALATGIIGLCIRSQRFWNVHCLRQAFWVMSLVTALMMIPQAVVTALVDGYYYSITDIMPLEVFAHPKKPSMEHTALIWIIIGLSIVEFVICLLSSSVSCCCAPTYREAEPEPVQQEEIIIKQQAPPPIIIQQKEEKPKTVLKAITPAQNVAVARPAAPQQVVVANPAPPVTTVVARPAVLPAPVHAVPAPPRPVMLAPAPRQPVVVSALPPRQLVQGPRLVAAPMMA